MLDYRLAALVLSPVLLVQGLKVRLTTPRLPEPPGPRSGAAGQGPALRLLIAGDSAAAGVGAPTQAEGLSGALAEVLQQEFRLEWVLHARTGLKTHEVLARLAALSAERFDVALMSLGVNDVTGGTRSRDFVAGQRTLVELLKSRFQVRLVLLTALPPMHAFPALPQPLRRVLGQRALAFTRLLEAVAEDDPSCEVVHPRLPLDPAYMAPDGFHPGPLAYLGWARDAADLIRRRLGQFRPVR